MIYELDWSRPDAEEFTNEAIVGILTGATRQEIDAALAEVLRNTGRSVKQGWHGPVFIKVFQKLGFNTGDYWGKFDPGTEKPCIMRTTSFQKGYWFAWIYDGELVNNKWTLDEWRKKWKKLKITSMLQVWI